jgi:outer membrane biosynthesis protein TonB
MSDHERGAYTPPTDAPLTFDARQPVRGSRPVPFTLIVSLLVLVALAAAIFVFYRSGVRQAGQPPQTVGAPVGEMKSEATPEAQPQDPAAGLQIYRSEDGQPQAVPPAPQFTPPPEQPMARPTEPVVAAPLAPAAAPAPNATALRPALPAAPAPAATTPAPAPKAAPAPAPVVTPPPKTASVPAPTTSAAGAAAVQIGAFSSQALADKGWNDAAAIAPGLAAGKGKRVERVPSGGGFLYRTQVTGFASRADASAFCSALKAAGKDCFVR